MKLSDFFIITWGGLGKIAEAELVGFGHTCDVRV